jgi:hypothetical protein
MAFLAFCRAIIEQNVTLEFPLAAELRKETLAERSARCANKIPKTGFKATFPHTNRWN